MQDALLQFAIPSVVAGAISLDSLLLRAREIGLPDTRFHCTHMDDACSIECSRDIAVILATHILFSASHDERLSQETAACERALSAILRLLQNSSTLSRSDPDEPLQLSC